MKNYAQNSGAKRNDIITIEYSAKVKSGTTVLSTNKEGPLTFRVGDFPLVKGLNEAVLGMKLGETKRVEIYPSEAFGEFDKSLVEEYPLKKLPDFIRTGQRIFLHGRRTSFNVIDVNSEDGLATLDGNHLLAGKDLSFVIKVICIKVPPTIKENALVEQNYSHKERTRSRKKAQETRKAAQEERTFFREEGFA